MPLCPLRYANRALLHSQSHNNSPLQRIVNYAAFAQRRAICRSTCGESCAKAKPNSCA